jgi:hypothetical protein
LEPTALLAQLRAHQAKIGRVRGTAKLAIRTPQLKGTVTEFVAAEKPDRLRLETYDFFGNPAAILVASGNRFSFYDAASKTYYRGTPTPENVSSLLPIIVPIGELVTILCGSAPVLDGRPISATPDGGRMLLVIDGGDGVGQQLTIAGGFAVESSRIRRVRTGPTGQPEQDNPAYDLAFDLFRPLAGFRFPGEVALEAPAAGVELELTWRPDLEVNVALEASLFTMDPPRGAKTVELAPDSAMPKVDLPVAPESKDPTRR